MINRARYSIKCIVLTGKKIAVEPDLIHSNWIHFNEELGEILDGIFATILLIDAEF